MPARTRRTAPTAEETRAALRGRILANRVVAFGVIALFMLAGFFWFRSAVSGSQSLRMTAGSTLSYRHRMAQILCDEAADQGLQIDLIESAGSLTALEDIASGKLDLALVLGDLDFPVDMIREVAVLCNEPLHLFVRPELADGGLVGLRGKRICLGADGTTSQKLARQLLEFVGMKSGEDYVEDNLTYEQMLQLPPDKLPEGIFAMTALPWVEVGEPLVQEKGYLMLELPFADAMGLRDPSLHDIIIPAFSYSVSPPVPPRPLHTLGHPLLIVASRDTPEAAIEQLMRVVFDGDFGRRARLSSLDPTAIDKARDFPLHPGALKYLHRNRPFITTDLIDRIENMRSFLVSAVLAVFLFWRWQKRRQLIGFEEYFDEVSEIELDAMVMDKTHSVDPDVIRSLRIRLSSIKGQALERHAEGSLNGEEEMSGFLTHVADVRSYLESLLAAAPPTPVAVHAPQNAASNGSTSTDSAPKPPTHSTTESNS